MSEQDNLPIWPPPRPPAPEGPNGCLTALLMLAGTALLLPGLCTLVFFGSAGRADPSIGMIAGITFLVALVGILLIVLAVRRIRR